MSKRFFEERSDQSEVKARIVEKYFNAWAQVVMPTAERRDGKIAYIDLYAGPGRYRDGSASTPLLVIERAIAHPKMSKMLVALLNDANKDNSSTLEAEIGKLPGIDSLRFKPEIACGEVDEDAAKYFLQTRMIPSFSFVDPFGYKGLSLEIVNGVIKDWGCDCVFFFNYNRINAGINNPAVAKHMNALFGERRADQLREELKNKSPELREALILEALAEEIKRLGGTYVLPFTFKNANGTRTSHKLIFVSTHFKGYDIMKDIMAKESSTHDEGVPSLTYSPADADMPLLFSLSRPLSALEQDLLTSFAGREVNFETMYEEHSVDRPYIRPNYRDILKKLEGENKITARSTKGKRRANTYPDHVLLKFPKET
ncbi:three-Cys-motif partner protein TcmP [Mesorhizobium sp. RP14(2022)]|uniref:Three-Cys-motif partner protein TcmP n=1 Tax=Mesorhizobium liriopis TaxID=2953882 RepID=A0ABT1C0X2_9HYPH|nr:three-Cys-motif partner protein TcmP [Mesorhizobium liriopis]MCO6048412.1 three-Cys-motif partner protein TcmP [Mesorhizobium liriopis]